MPDTKITLEIPAVVALSIAGLNIKRDVDLSKATDPAASAMILFAYGVQRWLNDKTGGGEQTEAERNTKADDRIKSLLAGTIKTGGGGVRLSDLEKATRKIVSDYLYSIGTKRADADKAATKPRAAFETFLAAKLKAAGKPHNVEAVEEAYAKNWPKVESQAKAIAEVVKAVPTVEV